MDQILEILALSEPEFLRQCRIDHFQASGPGGQKRNRKLSAVRLIHIQSSISVTSSEYRETSRNLAIAINKLKLELAIKLDLDPQIQEADLTARIKFNKDVSEQNPQFPLMILLAVTLFKRYRGSIRELSLSLNTSSPQLIKFLKKSKQVWTSIQEIRRQNGHPPLK